MATILVTGATGTIGSATARGLLQKPGVTVRLAVRDPKKADALGLSGAEIVAFTWGDKEQSAAIARGVEKLFLATPFSETQVEDATLLIDAAKAAGVSHIVKLSAMGAENEPGIQLGRWHRAIEKHIEQSGIPYTFLRPNNYFENFINYYPPASDGVIYLPFGQGKVSWIDSRDIADVAVQVLTTPGHQNKAYDLTGGEALGVQEVAQLLSEASGSNIRYQDIPEADARAGLDKYGAPSWMADALMELHAVDKAGYAAAISPNVQKLLGRPPRTFKDFAKEKARTWTR